MKTTLSWTGQLAFSGITPSGHEIKIDAAEEIGGKIVEQDLWNCFYKQLQGAQGLILL